MNKSRNEILDEVLELNTQIEELQKNINDLYKEAKQIEDKDDDDDKYGILECISSYAT